MIDDSVAALQTHPAGYGRGAATPRLWRFLLLSVVLHGLLLWPPASARQHMAALGETILAVRLEPGTPPRQRVTPFMTIASGESAQARSSPDDVSDTAAQNRHMAANASINNYLLGVLRHELARHLVYPPLARERGWQGTVVLGVTVTADGVLAETSLLQSSGHALLDEASLAGLRRIHSLPLTAGGLPAEHIRIVLPIHFQLTDNS
jgi:protein TonB